MNYRPVEKSQVDVKYAAVSVLIPNREEAEFIKSRCSLNIRISQFNFILILPAAALLLAVAFLRCATN